MSIVVKDETAGVVILTIDDSGNICFGDGTPINRLTLAGYGVIDANGYIIHGGSPGAVATVNGTIGSIPPNSSAAVTTLSGRTPVVRLSGNTYPATNTYFVVTGENPETGNETGYVQSDPINGVPELAATPYSGGFYINNNNTVQYDPNLNINAGDGGCNYDWM